jgi:hypothetical protein
MADPIKVLIVDDIPGTLRQHSPRSPTGADPAGVASYEHDQTGHEAGVARGW